MSNMKFVMGMKNCPIKSIGKHNLTVAFNLLKELPETMLYPSKYDKVKKLHIGLVKWSKWSSSDPKKLRKWAQRWPYAYFCIHLKASKLSVLDVDNKNGRKGSDSLKQLEVSKGPLPKTRITKTPSGGRHYLFSGWCGKQSKNKLGEGLDTPGMVPVPGSVVPGKGEYKIIKGGSLSILPAWIPKRLGDTKQRNKNHRAPAVTEDRSHNIKKAIKYAQHADPAIENDGGNNQTYNVACGVRDFGISRDTCLMIMAEHYNPECEPPWSYGDLKRIVYNAYNYARTRAGVNLPEADFTPVLTDAVEANRNLKNKPLPLDRKPQPEEYPLEYLPQLIQTAVNEVSAFSKAPISLIANCILPVISTVTQGLADVRRAEKLTGPISTFHFTIAESGERKSFINRFFTPVIKRYQTMKTDWMKEDINTYKAAHSAWEAKKNGKLDKIRQMSKKGEDVSGLEAELDELEQNMPETPKLPKYLLTDFTQEKLAGSLAQDWPSSALISPEGGIILGSFAMNNDSIMRFLSFVNTLWDGDAILIGRKGSGEILVDGVRFTIGIQTQEETFEKFMDRAGDLARGIGFFARCLFAYPNSNQGRRLFSDQDSWEGLEAFETRVIQILSLQLPLTDTGRLKPALFDLAPDAKAAWIDFHDKIELQLTKNGKYFNVRDAASKVAENAVRMAAQFQIFIDGAVGNDVSLENFQAAGAIVEWHLNEARRYFGFIKMSQEQKDAITLDDWLIDYCRKNSTNEITKREVQRQGPGAIRKKSRFENAIKELKELYRVEEVKCGRKRMIRVDAGLL
jgi:hypothetical protein